MFLVDGCASCAFSYAMFQIKILQHWDIRLSSASRATRVIKFQDKNRKKNQQRERKKTTTQKRTLTIYDAQWIYNLCTI